MSELVKVNQKQNKVFTTSLLIAKEFGKDHDRVLKDIRKLNCSEDFSSVNFDERDYENRGRLYPLFEITKNGFVILVMGYTGKKAMQFKERYIAEFDRMHSALKEISGSDWKKTRINGKIVRRAETDALLRLKVMAEEQREGKPYGMVYVNYTNLVNKLCNITTGQRNQATAHTLENIKKLEDATEVIVNRCVEANVFYKDVYKQVKEFLMLMVSTAMVIETNTLLLK